MQSHILKGGKLANTVGPPNKGHVGDNINSLVMSFVDRGCPLLGGSQCIETIGKETSSSALIIVERSFFTPPLSQRVPYWRFAIIIFFSLAV